MFDYKMTSIGIIIQARMGSTRLPSKIMLPINGLPVLQYQINRLKQFNPYIILATTNKIQDLPVVDFATKNQLRYFRGSENDVLNRYFECADFFKLDVIIRITSDCPLIDADILQSAIKDYLDYNDSQLYLSNTIQRSFPRGFDFEIFSFSLLCEANKFAISESDREHVTPYIWKNKSGKTKIKQIVRKEDKSRYRLTLDTPEDLSLIKELIERFEADKLSENDIINILDNNPNIVAINSSVEQKKV